jgi:xanthine dehydrogenase accessory factor
MDQTLLAKAFEAVKKGQKYAAATVLEATLKGTPRKSGAKMLVFEDGSSYGTIGGGRNEKAAITECLKALKTGKTKIVTYSYFGGPGQSVCGGQIKVFVEPFVIQKHFVICGAGHIALPLSLIGKMLNYQVTIVDNRKEFGNKKRFPHADKILVGGHEAQLSKIKFNQDTHVMIVTQGNETDYECLKFAVQTKAGYVGCISSKAKRIKFFNRLKDDGISAKLLKKIRMFLKFTDAVCLWL